MNIKPNDLVLEIGSGDNPRPRSDVLCDKIPEDDTQRGGAIVLDRPFIAADGQYLPFADKSFDYIICCHVLEHSEEPALFLSELMRVGHRGYMETPTEIGEKLYGWPYHQWFINLDSTGKLILRRKSEEGVFGQLFHYLFSTDPTYARFHAQNHHLFLIQYEWSEKIDYEIVESDSVLMDLNTWESVEKLVGEQTRTGIAATVKNLVPGGVRQRMKSAIVKSKGKHKKTLQDIKSMIVCPVCKGQVEWHDDSISCQSCDGTYPIKDGVPFMLAE
ncbi:methyltransferase domain-containing protein [Candidatus Poribacteria bacterium]